MGLLEDLADALVDAGVGILSVNLFRGFLPDAPDSAVALFETAGLPPLYTHNGLLPAIERPSIQVLVRDQTDKYAAGRARIQHAYDTLCGLTTYLAIQPVQMPFSLARDAQNRPRFSVNFTITTRGGS